MRPTRVRWRILSLMVIGSAVAYVLRLDVSIAGEAMMRDLSLTPVQLGLILSAFAWAYAGFQLPGGLLGEWLGPRRALAALITGWAALTLAMALIPAGASAGVVVGVAMSIRLLMGAAQAPFFPITSGCSVREWFPVRDWAMPNALMSLGNMLGGAVAGPVVVFLVMKVGWRGAFVALAPLGLVGAALWWWYTRDDPATHPHANQAELELIRSDPPPPVPDGKDALRAVLLRRDVLLLTASYGAVNYVFYLFFNWFYFYLTDVRRFPAQISGWYTGLQWSIGAAAALAGGLLCEWLARRYGTHLATRFTAVPGLLGCAVFLVAGAALTRPVLAVLLLSLSFACTQLVDVAYWVAAMVVAGRHAAAATGLMNTGGNAAGAVGAITVPLVAGSAGWFAAVASGAVFALLAAALWAWISVPAPAGAAAPGVEAVPA